MLKIGLGYNIVYTDEISVEGVYIDERGKDRGESFVKGHTFFYYSSTFYRLILYTQDNNDFTCYTNGMTAEDSAKPIKSESKMFHIMIKYIFKPEVKEIEIEWQNTQWFI